MKPGIEKLVRKEVFNFEPYLPGKPVAELAREKNLSAEKIIKLASNENPLGPSKKTIAALRKNLKNIYFYPESTCPELRKKLVEKLRVKPENLIFGNGSDEIIELIGKTFLNPEDEIIVSEHAFIRYKMAGDLMGCRVVTVPMTPPLRARAGFTHDLEAMVRAVTKRTKIIFIANPNNPTGTYNTNQELEGFFQELSTINHQPLTVIDEAYYEYAKGEKDYPDTLSYLSEENKIHPHLSPLPLRERIKVRGKLLESGYSNIIILRTFSKIYGLAGLRIGYGIAKKEIIDFLERMRPPFNVNSLAQEAALASLSDGKQVKKSVELVKKEKKFFYSELKKLGIEFLPSAANFIFFKVPRKGKEIFQEFLNEGIIIRSLDEYGFPNHIRVTIGLPEENRRFIQVFKKILS